MFNDFAHFNQNTQKLFDETCTNNLDLSQYRDRVSQIIGFSNTQSLKEYFEKNNKTISLFADFSHFKKGTKLLFNETCSNGLKLSEYREKIAQMMGFNDTESLQEHFENSDERIQVVSVILYTNNSIDSKYDFKDTVIGNKLAEERFRNILKKHMPSYDDVDIDDCLDNGYYQDDNSNYQLFITHSSE